MYPGIIQLQNPRKLSPSSVVLSFFLLDAFFGVDLEYADEKKSCFACGKSTDIFSRTEAALFINARSKADTNFGMISMIQWRRTFVNNCIRILMASRGYCTHGVVFVVGPDKSKHERRSCDHPPMVAFVCTVKDRTVLELDQGSQLSLWQHKVRK